MITMVYDAFYAPLDIIPDHVKKAYKIKASPIIIFSSSGISPSDLNFEDGKISINGQSFSYHFMSMYGKDNASESDIIIHDMPKHIWDALTNAFKSTYRSYLDKEAILLELDGLPFKDNDSAIDFFIEEIVFSPEDGMLPLGLAIMDTALHKTLPLCKARHKLKVSN